jgi:hypothetical protein
VQLDPLSLIAHAHLALGLWSMSRHDEAIEAAQVILDSEPTLNSFTWAIVGMLLLENHDVAAIHYVESCLEQLGRPDTNWFRDLVAHARNPASGQAYLDRRIPEITAAMSNQGSLRRDEELLALYLYFGFLDRHFELVMATGPTDQTWHYAGIHVWRGTIFRKLGFTHHKDYLALANLLSIDDGWGHRGLPDFCRRRDDRWSCD